jgi:SAM-dependent methyltransferase
VNAHDTMASADHIHDSRFKAPRGGPIIAARTVTGAVCPLCGSGDTDHAFKDSGCALRTCNVCELFFVHPYPASTPQHACVSSGEYAGIELLDCERRYQGERLYYDRHFPSIADECRDANSLLDVGCGTGNLLERFAGRPNMHRLGIELNHRAARFARRAAGCDIREVPFEQFRSDRKYDVMTMINVFSHIPSFDGMFRSLRAALAPAGKVILRTSEMSRDVTRWNQVHWGIPDDLHFLGLQTIDFICAKYGFVVVRRLQTPYEDELFLPSRWEQPGRSVLLNLAKATGVHVPGVLPGLKNLYAAALGKRLFVSLIVLKPLAAAQANGTYGGTHT